VRPGELKNLLSDNGLKVAASTGVSINPVSKKFSLSNRLAVNYMLSAIPVSGARP
jgi:2-polyprenyl-3-methyl-5-hydroxy-6-metoxy-1,4-benzoquinol methylase